MSTLPRLLVSSVVRGSQQGDSHGGLYIVDVDRAFFEQVIDWNDCGISFEGRGADRGLRGIALDGDLIFVAASDELFLFDRAFSIVSSFRNPYLKHCHEICLHQGQLFLTSTGFDCILRFNVSTGVFDWGLALQTSPTGLAAREFDPRKPDGPRPSLALHINNVSVGLDAIYIAGRRLPVLLRAIGNQLSVAAPLPLGTHNAQPWLDGILFNDTESDCIRWVRPGGQTSVPVPRYSETMLERAGLDTSGLARQAFGRGLCSIVGDFVAAGSSPSTVSIYNLHAGTRVASLNLTMDVRNAVHGMAVWKDT